MSYILAKGTNLLQVLCMHNCIVLVPHTQIQWLASTQTLRCLIVASCSNTSIWSVEPPPKIYQVKDSEHVAGEAQIYYRRVLAVGVPQMHALICLLFPHYHVNYLLRISQSHFNPFFFLNVFVTAFLSTGFKMFPC